MEAGATSAWGEWAMPGQQAEAYMPPPPSAPVARANPDDARNRRVLAFIIDQLVILLGVFAAATLRPEGLSLFETVAHEDMLALGTLTAFAYYVVLEGCFGQTLGKAAMDVRVVDRTMGHAGFGRIVVRTILRAADHFFVCLVGAIATIVSGPGRRQRIGDMAGGTFVVRQSQTTLKRGSDASIAVIGLAVALIPAAVMASPAGAHLVQASDAKQVQTIGSQFVKDAQAGDHEALCASMSNEQRKAIVARETGGRVLSASAADCAPHASMYVKEMLSNYGLYADGTFVGEATHYGAAAGPKTAPEPLLTFVRESGAWKVDHLAAERKDFIAGCKASSGAAHKTAACVCIWGEVRGTVGTVHRSDFARVMFEAQRGHAPGWMQTAATRCARA